MRPLFLILSALAVLSLAIWAYRENYATQEALKKVEGLHREIAVEREVLAVLKAEWAWLNRPERLRDLAELNFDRLGLLPLQPEQFGRIDQIAYPPLPTELEIVPIEDAVEVLGTLDAPEQIP